MLYRYCILVVSNRSITKKQLAFSIYANFTGTEKDWMVQAEKDLDTARVLLGSGKYFASAFYSQQAVEKTLKSLILYLGKDPGKTQSLTELAEIIETRALMFPLMLRRI